MARQLGQLTVIAVNKAKAGKLYADGGNLYLQVSYTGAKSWLFRYMIDGVQKTMGLILATYIMILRQLRF